MAYLTWEEYQQQYPAPYDLETFTNLGNQTYAGMDYNSRPQEWLDEYERMRRANMEWQANYYNGGFSAEAPSNFAMLNPFIQQSGRPYYDVYGNVSYIGESPPQVDWYAEAAAGRPVIGGSVPASTPNGSGGLNFAGGGSWSPGQPNPYNGGGQLAYPTGGGLPVPNPTPTNLSSSNQAALDVGQGLKTLGNALTRAPQYSGGGTISNFWDQSGGSQNTGSVPSPMSNMGLVNSFQDWFTKTYGSNYGM